MCIVHDFSEDRRAPDENCCYDRHFHFYHRICKLFWIYNHEGARLSRKPLGQFSFRLFAFTSKALFQACWRTAMMKTSLIKWLTNNIKLCTMYIHNDFFCFTTYWAIFKMIWWDFLICLELIALRAWIFWQKSEVEEFLLLFLTTTFSDNSGTFSPQFLTKVRSWRIFATFSDNDIFWQYSPWANRSKGLNFLTKVRSLYQT